MYKVKFFDNNRNRYDFCEFGLLEGETLYDKLEEVLYIMQELTPQHPNWKLDLTHCGTCLFTYHNIDIVMVSVNGTEISVRDC